MNCLNCGLKLTSQEMENQCIICGGYFCDMCFSITSQTCLKCKRTGGGIVAENKPEASTEQDSKKLGEAVLGKKSICKCSNAECDYSYIKTPWDKCDGKCPKCGSSLQAGDISASSGEQKST